MECLEAVLDGDEELFGFGWVWGESVAEPCLRGTVQLYASEVKGHGDLATLSSYRRIESTGLPIED